MYRPLSIRLTAAFWASPSDSMAMIASWETGRCDRGAIALHATTPGDDLPSYEPEEPLPTPTDVPVPEPHDVPAPEPMDPPVPEPGKSDPPARPGQDPQPRPIP